MQVPMSSYWSTSPYQLTYVNKDGVTFVFHSHYFVTTHCGQLQGSVVVVSVAIHQTSVS